MLSEFLSQNILSDYLFGNVGWNFYYFFNFKIIDRIVTVVKIFLNQWFFYKNRHIYKDILCYRKVFRKS